MFDVLLFIRGLPYSLILTSFFPHTRVTDEPYREGHEIWLPIEMSRVLLLTSTIGFTSRSCYVKMLVAQICAAGYLFAFLYAKPYRRGLHNFAQALVSAVPVLSMGYFLAGGWEDATRQTQAGADSVEKDAAFDAGSIVTLHAFIFVPPVLTGLFTLGSTLWLWQHRLREERRLPAAVRSEVTMLVSAKIKGASAVTSGGSRSSWSSWSSWTPPPPAAEGADGAEEAPEKAAAPAPEEDGAEVQPRARSPATVIRRKPSTATTTKASRAKGRSGARLRSASDGSLLAGKKLRRCSTKQQAASMVAKRRRVSSATGDGEGSAAGGQQQEGAAGTQQRKTKKRGRKKKGASKKRTLGSGKKRKKRRRKKGAGSSRTTVAGKAALRESRRRSLMVAMRNGGGGPSEAAVRPAGSQLALHGSSVVVGPAGSQLTLG